MLKYPVKTCFTLQAPLTNQNCFSLNTILNASTKKKRIKPLTTVRKRNVKFDHVQSAIKAESRIKKTERSMMQRCSDKVQEKHKPPAHRRSTMD